jgi:uncharacterized membrane protein YoaK (UPF0700 family)
LILIQKTGDINISNALSVSIIVKLVLAVIIEMINVIANIILKEGSRMIAIIILAIISFILFLGLLWCISSIHCLCGAIKSILETMSVYDKMLGLEE